MLIAVGSQNPVKIEATRIGTAQAFDVEEIVVVGVGVESGVSAQPMGDDETITGAAERALAALDAMPEATYGIGLEGGVVSVRGGLFTCAWCVVADRTGKMGLASTGRFQLPPAVSELVRAGKELGEADDMVFGRSNSKQNEGACGILTHGKLVRAQFYSPAVLLACIRFINQEYFD
jgi:inosine/xanthosine triphosphatase